MRTWYVIDDEYTSLFPFNHDYINHCVVEFVAVVQCEQFLALQLWQYQLHFVNSYAANLCERRQYGRKKQ